MSTTYCFSGSYHCNHDYNDQSQWHNGTGSSNSLHLQQGKCVYHIISYHIISYHARIVDVEVC